MIKPNIYDIFNKNQEEVTLMHRSIAGHNPYIMFINILTIDFTKNFTTRQLLTIRLMAIFVVKSSVIEINDQDCESINYLSLPPVCTVSRWCTARVARPRVSPIRPCCPSATLRSSLYPGSNDPTTTSSPSSSMMKSP